MEILFIAPRMPYPPVKGDRLRAYNFIKELSRQHTVDLCVFYESESDLDHSREMKKYCRYVEMVPLGKLEKAANLCRIFYNFLPFQVNYYYSGKMKLAVAAMTAKNNYDIVHIVLARMLPYSKAAQARNIVLDHIDALSLNMMRRASKEVNFLKKALFNFEYINMKNYERSHRQDYGCSIVTSEIDRQALEDGAKVIPNGVDSDYFKPQSREKDLDLVFTGNMNYFPNVDAMLFFCGQVLPLIKKEIPEVKLHIVGIDPGREVRGLEKYGNVTVTGFVPDVREYLNRAKVFVAPLRSGSGIQNKVLEAMACALPVVSTCVANAGIKADCGSQIILADNENEFAAAVIKLLKDPEKGTALGVQAREFVEKKFCWHAEGKVLEKIYRDLIEKNIDK